MEIFKLLGTIAINNTSANDAIDATTTKAESSQGKISTAFGKIGGAAKKIGTAAAGAALAVGGAMTAIVESTREYRTEMGKLEAAYSTAGHSADAAKTTFSTLSSLLGDDGQAVEAANHLAKLVTDEKDLATWTDICTGVYATFGDSLPIEGLTEAANETAKTGALTGGLADALNWAGVSEDEFQASLDACSTEQERQALITNTLNGLYADAATKYKEVNADVLAANDAQGRLTAAMAGFGAILEPVVTAGKAAFATLLESILPFAESLATGVPTAMTFLQNAWDTVLKPVMDLIGQIFTEIAVPAVQLLITTFQNMATFAQQHFGFVQGVVSGVLTAIQGIINAIGALIKGDWTKFWQSIVTIVKGIGTALKEAGKGVFNLLFSGMKSVWTSISNWVSEKVGWITAKFEAVKGILSSIGTAVSTVGSKVGSVLGGGNKVAAHAAGGILTKPTIFGYTPSTGTYHLGGEAGAEAIAPIGVLQGYVRSAVDDALNATGNDKVTNLLEQMVGLLQISATNNTTIEINGREFGRMVKEYA